jgi:hypothetical protein
VAVPPDEMTIILQYQSSISTSSTVSLSDDRFAVRVWFKGRAERGF